MTRRPPITLEALRAHAVRRTFFAPTTLPSALRRMGFVQADPIRAPARAQDLILRHRVRDYRDGDLERRYPRLPVEEDVLHNYGFFHRDLQPLVHPRVLRRKLRIERAHPKLIGPVLEFVRANGPTHPRELDADHGGRSVRNYWGGSSSAATHVLDMLHYRGILRVVRRDAGTRVYAVAGHLPRTPDAPEAAREKRARLVALLVALYGPMPEASLRQTLMMLRYGAPHHGEHWRDRSPIRHALDDGLIAVVEVEGQRWYLPAGERVRGEPELRVRLLAPFDPLVWDRRRFEQFWEWRYRFEAYTPPAKRVLGYYALPLLWGDRVIGWGNVALDGARLDAEVGFVERRPRDPRFLRALDDELGALAEFLGADRVRRAWRA